MARTQAVRVLAGLTLVGGLLLSACGSEAGPGSPNGASVVTPPSATASRAAPPRGASSFTLDELTGAVQAAVTVEETTEGTLTFRDKVQVPITISPAECGPPVAYQAVLTEFDDFPDVLEHYSALATFSTSEEYSGWKMMVMVAATPSEDAAQDIFAELRKLIGACGDYELISRDTSVAVNAEVSSSEAPEAAPLLSEGQGLAYESRTAVSGIENPNISGWWQYRNAIVHVGSYSGDASAQSLGQILSSIGQNIVDLPN